MKECPRRSPRGARSGETGVNVSRCAKCRTWVEAEPGANCFACGAALPAVPLAMIAGEPTAAHEVHKDRKPASVMLAAIGVSGLFGLVAMFQNPRLDPTFSAVVVGGVVVAGLGGLVFARTARKVSYDHLGELALHGMAGIGFAVVTIVGLVIGLLVLMFAACSLGIFDGGFH